MQKYLFDTPAGEPMWRCLRCQGEHAQLGPERAHAVMVGNETIAWVCNGCREKTKAEILALVPEHSFHGTVV